MSAHFYAHTPIELALIIFEVFPHIYLTRHEQIHFSRNCTPAELLLDYTIHDMWLNSKALKMGNVTKDTQDPVPGLIYWVRDEDGNATGLAKEFAWMGPFIDMGAWQPELSTNAAFAAFAFVRLCVDGTGWDMLGGVRSPEKGCIVWYRWQPWAAGFGHCF